MITSVCQRWRDHRGTYRPADERIDTAKHEVVAIDESRAKAFVLSHHYSSSYPAARFRFGLFCRGELVGVSVFSHPVNDAVLTNEFPCSTKEAVELGRFVLLDRVAGNGETWFLARAFELLRAESIAGVVSYSDPLPRDRADGVTIFGGHVGTIYQAHNAVYRGRARGGQVHLLPDGSVFSRRTLQKIRCGERGWRYGVEQLVRGGARVPRAGEDWREWLAEALAAATRKVRHPGNHKYVWGLTRAMRRHVDRKLEAFPYPKLQVAA